MIMSPSGAAWTAVSEGWHYVQSNLACWSSTQGASSTSRRNRTSSRHDIDETLVIWR